MTFQPKSGEHAIVEVVFGVLLSRPLVKAEVDAVIGSHSVWRDWMPKIDLQEGMVFRLGPNGPEVQKGELQAVVFERMRPDGSPEWRLRVEGQSIFVNCLAYTRWEEIWGRTSGLLDTVLKLIANDDVTITGILMQYIDIFEWVAAPEAYNPRELLAVGDMIPSRVLSSGPWWHLHQGWFKFDEPTLPKSRLLEKLHIDSVVDDAGRPTVKLDSYLSYDLPAALPVAGGISKDGELFSWFQAIHNLDKALMRYVLTPQAQEIIHLDG